MAPCGPFFSAAIVSNEYLNWYLNVLRYGYYKGIILVVIVRYISGFAWVIVMVYMRDN